MAFAYPTSGAPALAAPTVHGYGLSTTPAVLPGVPTPVGQTFAPFSTYGASAAPFGQDFSSLSVGAAPFGGASSFGAFGGATPFVGAAAPIVADSGLFAGALSGATPFAGAAAPIVADSGLFAGALGGATPFAGAAAPIVADSGLLTAGAPIVSDFNGLYSGYQGLSAPFDAGFGGAPFVAPSVYGGYGAGTVTGAIAAPVAPARKVWQNGLRRSLVTGHPTRF